jgi:hypothetical protein
MTFVHAHKNKGYDYQRIYLSDDRELLMEKSINYEIHLYKRQNMPNFETTREVKWIHVRRVINYSNDLSEFSKYNYLYSPNLLMFIDSDNHGDCFMIRNTFDQSIVLKFPTGILSPVNDHPQDIVKKFMWIDNKSFKIVNADSQEKIFEIMPDKTLKVVGYGMVFMFDHSRYENKTAKFHFYMDN